MRRHRHHVLAVLSLILFVAVCASWRRGYRLAEAVSYTVGRQSIAAGSDRGSLFLAWNTNARPGGFYYLGYPAKNGEHPLLGSQNFAGFGVRAGGLSPGLNGAARTDFRVLVFPTWALALLLGVVTVEALRRDRRGRRRRGLCQTCGYDLRATPDCCPECGAVPEGRMKRLGRLLGLDAAVSRLTPLASLGLSKSARRTTAVAAQA